MRILSYFLALALFGCFSCSDDDDTKDKTPVRGTLKIDDVTYDLHRVYGQAEVGSDYSYYTFIVLNSNGKVNDDEELTGSGINGIRFNFYRDEATNVPITGTFYNDVEEEHYEIEELDAVTGYDASDEDSGLFYDDYDFAEVVISKTGSNYKLIFEGTTSDGVEIRMTYEGPLETLQDLTATLL